ncbi:MAG: hypothetical protein ACOZAN_01080 [Patescibacteria group bacterium]
MKKLFFALAWMLVTTGSLFLGVALFHFSYLAKNDQAQLAWQPDKERAVQISSAKENNPPTGEVMGVETVMESEDGRAEIVAKFLERYKSPLQPYDYFGEKFVEIADRYEIDFRLLPAIAMQESNLCKRIPEGTFNCLGFGIHAKGTLGFSSYEEGFERAAKELKAYYIDKGRLTPEDIMRKYTPHSNGSWANSVNQWMAEMRYDDRQKGKELKTNANVLEFAVSNED